MRTIEIDDQTFGPDDEGLRTIWPQTDFGCDECNYIGKPCGPCKVEMQDDDYNDRVAEAEYEEATAAYYVQTVEVIESFQVEMARRGIVIATPAPSEEILEFFDCDRLRDKYLEGAKPTVGAFSEALQLRLDRWFYTVKGVENPNLYCFYRNSYEGPGEPPATAEEIEELEAKLREAKGFSDHDGAAELPTDEEIEANLWQQEAARHDNEVRVWQAVELCQAELAQRGIMVRTPTVTPFDVDLPEGVSLPDIGGFSVTLVKRLLGWDSDEPYQRCQFCELGPDNPMYDTPWHMDCEERAYWRRSAETHQMTPPLDIEHEHDPELCWGCDRDLSACGPDSDEDWHQGLHCHDVGHCPIQDQMDREADDAARAEAAINLEDEDYLAQVAITVAITHKHADFLADTT